MLPLLRKDGHCYLNPKGKPPGAVFIRSFVCVFRGSKILTYRLGRYRDDRDTFLHKRSIGFSTLVHINERTLFNVADLGIVDAGVRATKIDLDIPAAPDAPGRVAAHVGRTGGGYHANPGGRSLNPPATPP
jgi:hypothetical protein